MSITAETWGWTPVNFRRLTANSQGLSENKHQGSKHLWKLKTKHRPVAFQTISNQTVMDYFDAAQI